MTCGLVVTMHREGDWEPGLEALLPRAACDDAQAAIAGWPAAHPTPLWTLPGLAHALGLGQLWIKDEGSRLGVGSFKALGAPYALARALARRLPGVSPPALMAGEARDACAAFTAAAATDGNHGRGLAWGAAQVGCRAVIFVPAAISLGRVQALEALGAQVVRGLGSYDDAVVQCAATCRREGWLEITDTLSPGRVDPEISATVTDIMAGYTGLVDESLAEGAAPTHVVVQAGVGGLAAAVAGRLWQRLGAARPRLIVVEPERAACVQASARAGRPTPADGDLDTVMAGLACGEVSLPAWALVHAAACAFLVVPDSAAVSAMRRLAQPLPGDPAVVAGETGAAGVAGLLTLLPHPDWCEALDLGPDSRVLAFVTEGATDPALYTALVACSGDAGLPPRSPPGAMPQTPFFFCS